MSPAAAPSGCVSIVVLNWNSGELGSLAVRSALAQDWTDIEVIVVDNASTDQSVEHIRTAHGDRVTIIENDDNLGFGPGMNVGIAASSGKYVLPLNCDAELDNSYVSTLVGVLDDHPRTAGAGGCVRSERVGTSGPLAITRTMRTDSLPAGEPLVCDKVNGACPLFRRNALDQVTTRFGGGPYDPSYAMYGEDVDLALTLGRLGWDYRFEPSATAAHVRSFASAPKLADRRGPLRVSTLTNRHRNIVRHSERWVLTNLFAVCQDIGFAVIGATRGDLSATRDVAQAWRAHAGSLRLDRERRAALAMRRPALMTA